MRWSGGRSRRSAGSRSGWKASWPHSCRCGRSRSSRVPLRYGRNSPGPMRWSGGTNRTIAASRDGVPAVAMRWCRCDRSCSLPAARRREPRACRACGRRRPVHGSGPAPVSSNSVPAGRCWLPRPCGPSPRHCRNRTTSCYDTASNPQSSADDRWAYFAPLQTARRGSLSNCS